MPRLDPTGLIFKNEFPQFCRKKARGLFVMKTFLSSLADKCSLRVILRGAYTITGEMDKRTTKLHILIHEKKQWPGFARSTLELFSGVLC